MVQNNLGSEKDTAFSIIPTETAEEKLAKQVPVLVDGSNQIPFVKGKIPRSMVEPAKITYSNK